MSDAILLVDDEANIRLTLGAKLRALGHTVIEAADGTGCLSAAATPAVGLVVLDLGLPDLDGVDVLRALRSWSQVPVLVLSARDDQAQKVAALDAGADDYVTKPFDPSELEARIRAGLRRGVTGAPGPHGSAPDRVVFGDYVLVPADRSLRHRGVDVPLTPNELGLLLVLAAHPGRLLSHEFLLKAVWGESYGSESSYLRTYLSQLRRKLGDNAGRPTVIRTEPGLGYRWIAGPGPGVGSGSAGQ